jgi:hypothetical protein
MARESKFWTERVKPKLTGHSERIESPIASGIPDVVNIAKTRVNWIELKDKPTWEEGLGTTRIQRYWLTRWYAEGGNAFLLARCGKEMFFVSAEHLQIMPGQTLEDFRMCALVWSPVAFQNPQWSIVNTVLSTGRHPEPTANALVHLF